MKAEDDPVNSRIREDRDPAARMEQATRIERPLSEERRSYLARAIACDRICDELGYHVDRLDAYPVKHDPDGSVWVTVKVHVPADDIRAEHARAK